MVTAVVFQLTGGAGFFSNFLFLAQSYIYAKKNGYEFFIEHVTWNYTYEKGWHDYFKTLRVFDPSIPYDSVIYGSHVANPLQALQFSLKEYIDAIHELLEVHDELKEKVTTFIKNMDTEEYAAIFIRRGDKITTGESPYISTEDILNYTTLSSYKKIFVQSDTFETVTEVKKLLPESTIYHTVPEDKQGWFINDYNSLPKSQVKADFEEVLIGLLICLQSRECWTDSSSNVGRFLKLAAIDTVKFYPVQKSNYHVGRYQNNPIDVSKIIVSPAYYSSFD